MRLMPHPLVREVLSCRKGRTYSSARALSGCLIFIIEERLNRVGFGRSTQLKLSSGILTNATSYSDGEAVSWRCLVQSNDYEGGSLLRVRARAQWAECKRRTRRELAPSTPRTGASRAWRLLQWPRHGRLTERFSTQAERLHAFLALARLAAPELDAPLPVRVLAFATADVLARRLDALLAALAHGYLGSGRRHPLRWTWLLCLWSPLEVGTSQPKMPAAMLILLSLKMADRMLPPTAAQGLEGQGEVACAHILLLSLADGVFFTSSLHELVHANASAAVAAALLHKQDKQIKRRLVP
ncbi:hypothetical protein T492DRAFT_1141667, partial [Pavlovales sp. CCMP2436]